MVDRYTPKQAIGYGRPPEHTRFKKGQSGSPSGRPPKNVTLADVIAEELQSKVFITENGKRLKMEKSRVMFKQALNKAIAGDFRQLSYAMKIFDKLNQIISLVAKNTRAKKSTKDFNKLSLDEKIKKMKELIADTKPLEDY